MCMHLISFNWSLCQFGEWQSHNLSSKKEKRCHKFEMRTCTCHFESILIRSSVHAPIWCTVWVWVHESREYMVMTLPFELIWASVSISLGAMRREKAFFWHQCEKALCFLQFPTWGDMLWHGKRTQALAGPASLVAVRDGVFETPLAVVPT